jgi:hypothetical protein
MHKHILILASFAALSACGLSRPEQAITPSKAWLVGGWVIEGQSCDSDAGIIYAADGRWTSYGASGTWRLDRNRILAEVTHDDEGLSRSDRSHVERIEEIGRDSYLARRDDGSSLRMRRCGIGARKGVPSRHGKDRPASRTARD